MIFLNSEVISNFYFLFAYMYFLLSTTDVIFVIGESKCCKKTIKEQILKISTILLRF